MQFTNVTASALVAVSISLAITSPAQAEDASVPTWNGQYAGITLGAAHGKADPTVRTRMLGYFITTDDDQLDPVSSDNFSQTQLSGDVFFGLNRQSENMVYGLEAGLSVDNFDDQRNSGTITFLSAPAIDFSVNTRVRSKWSMSLRPRLGYATEKSLVYVSAGPSVRKFNYDFTYSDNNAPPRYQHVAESKWALGGIVGLGFDYKLQNDWSVRSEYLYSFYPNAVDFQSTMSLTPDDGFNHTLDFEAHSLRVGLVKMF